MAHRLIFTSTARGLTGGRSGFCTVARSRDMSDKLANLVEKCSVYDHEKNMGLPVYSHKKIFFAGHNRHVLTRTIETHPDYTNRSNYISEHLILSDAETVRLPSPAQLLLNKSDWLDGWDSEPQWLDDVEIKPEKPEYEPPAKTWQNIFGDAGKAALLGKSAPSIIARPQDAETLLKLFAESASLQTSASHSWDYTFTTSFSDSENPADYNWKAFTGRTAALGQSINLTDKTAPEAPHNAMASYARTGQISNRDRLGLKVGTPQDISPRIYLAKEEKKAFPYIPVAAAGALSLLGLSLLVFLYNPKQEDAPDSFSKMEPANGQNHSAINVQNVDVAHTYTKVIERVKDSIENKEWQEALDLWDESDAKDFNPKGRLQILSDIGKQADKLMDAAEKIYASPMKTSDDEPKAVADLHAARRALEIDGLPQKKVRLERWQKLEKLIKKL